MDTKRISLALLSLFLGVLYTVALLGFAQHYAAASDSLSVTSVCRQCKEPLHVQHYTPFGAYPSVMMIMSNPPRNQPRYSARSQLQEQQAIQAMSAYASIRGYDVYLPFAPADGPPARTPWDKIRVLYQAMLFSPDVDWFFVIDNDVLPIMVDKPLVNATGHVLAKPWSTDPKYAAAENPEFIVTGNPAVVYDSSDPHPNKEINSGVMGVRNTPWGRELVRNMTVIGADWTLGNISYVCEHGNRCHYGCDGGWCTTMKDFFGKNFMYNVYDQHAVVYLIRQLNAEDRRKVLLADWGFNYPTQISEVGRYHWRPRDVIFQHWPGCTMGRDMMPTAGFHNATAREECFDTWAYWFTNVTTSIRKIEQAKFQQFVSIVGPTKT